MRSFGRVALSVLLLFASAGCTAAEPAADSEAAEATADERASAQDAGGRAEDDLGARCDDLLGADVPETTLLSADLVPAGPEAVEHCAVSGTVRTEGDETVPFNEVRFSLGLPTDWNGDFYFLGVGGFAGTLADPQGGLERGYATATTDTGHEGSHDGAGPTRDGSWALGNVPRQVDWGYRGTHVATVATRALTRAYYGSDAEHAFFEGCSNGGRQGLMEAQRYPDDYDGILAHAPAVSAVDMFRTWIRQVQAQLADDGAWVSPEDLVTASTATLGVSERDGAVADGIVVDPRSFAAEHRQALEEAGVDGPRLRAFDAIYGFSDHVDGEPASARPVGHEEGWEPFITGSEAPVTRADGRWTFADVPGAPAAYSLTNEFLRYFVFDDPAYDLIDLDLDEQGDLLESYRDILDATDPDLTAFEAGGGKLLVTHGWADPALDPHDTIAYVQEVEQVLGEAASSAVRLYMVPGMFHCGGGPGLTNFDALTALEAWVRDGVAPGELAATDGADRSAPLCPYPQRTRPSTEGSSPWRCAAG